MSVECTELGWAVSVSVSVSVLWQCECSCGVGVGGVAGAQWRGWVGERVSSAMVGMGCGNVCVGSLNVNAKKRSL